MTWNPNARWSSNPTDARLTLNPCACRTSSRRQSLRSTFDRSTWIQNDRSTSITLRPPRKRGPRWAGTRRGPGLSPITSNRPISGRRRNARRRATCEVGAYVIRSVTIAAETDILAREAQAGDCVLTSRNRERRLGGLGATITKEIEQRLIAAVVALWACTGTARESGAILGQRVAFSIRGVLEFGRRTAPAR